MILLESKGNAAPAQQLGVCAQEILGGPPENAPDYAMMVAVAAFRRWIWVLLGRAVNSAMPFRTAAQSISSALLPDFLMTPLHSRYLDTSLFNYRCPSRLAPK